MENKIIGINHMLRADEVYPDFLVRLYPEIFEGKGSLSVKTLTFQVTNGCNLACSYCYQINKSNKIMKFEDAKLLLDNLLEGKYENYKFDVENSPGLIIEFIGGEPFLAIDLIQQICDYFEEQLILRHHPWLLKHSYSISTNGVLYFDPRVQKFLNEYKDFLSLSITLDGDKELHDSCRKFPDGSPSYDLALAAVKDWVKKGNKIGSKITIAPQNVMYLSKAMKHFLELGYRDIHINYVYEEGWTQEHATILYNELKIVADFLIENELVESTFISIFEFFAFGPMSDHRNKNWCGGDGEMLAMDPDGDLYPCIRYMESSLGTDQEPYKIGNVRDGIGTTSTEQQRLRCLACITRKSQSTDECYNCPIADGCGWCTAYNYQVNGSPDSRCIFICEMHKARSLANAYYWNSYFNKYNLPLKFQINCPKEWAVSIIGEEEYNFLMELSNREGEITNVERTEEQ